MAARRTSIGSTGSAGSILSVGSVGSILSIGSAGSILSVGSAGSILSIGSAGSILSIGSAGSILSVGGFGSVRGRRPGAVHAPEPADLGVFRQVEAPRRLRAVATAGLLLALGNRC
jgi:hypothetical protein